MVTNLFNCNDVSNLNIAGDNLSHPYSRKRICDRFFVFFTRGLVNHEILYIPGFYYLTYNNHISGISNALNIRIICLQIH